jgi:hypothetical protein
LNYPIRCNPDISFSGFDDLGLRLDFLAHPLRAPVLWPW